MYISEDDKFADDQHQIIPTDDISALPFLTGQNLKGFNCGYYIPAQVVAFKGTYYHKSVMLDLVTLVHLPLTIFSIDKDM